MMTMMLSRSLSLLLKEEGGHEIINSINLSHSFEKPFACRVKPKLAILSTHSELKNKNAFCDDTKVFQSHVRQSYCRIIILHGHSCGKCRMMDRSKGYDHVPVARVHVFNCLNNFIPCRELLSAYHQIIIPKLSSLNGHHCFCHILSRCKENIEFCDSTPA